MYSASAYYFAKVVSDLPFQILYPILFGTISYWLIGFQREATNYLIFVATIILIANVGAGVGLLLSKPTHIFYSNIRGAIAPSSSVAITLVPVTIIPFMLFSGFLVNSNNVPDYFIWIQYLSFVKVCYFEDNHNQIVGF